MTSAKTILLAAALQGVVVPLAAQGNRLTELFPKAPAGYVTDVAGAIDPAARVRIAALVERLRNGTGAEIAVAVLPTIGDYAAADVAVAIGRAWGVGAKAAIGDQRRNAGIVILLVPKRPDDPNSGQVFIATGQGLEGIVTDLQAGRVRDLMRPFLSRGEYGAGLDAGVGALAGLIAREMGVSDSMLAAADRLPRGAEPRDGRQRFPLSLIIVIIFVLLVSLNSRRGPPRSGRRRRGPGIFWSGWGGGGFGGGGFGGFGGGGGGGGFGGFGGGGGFSGGGAGGRF